MTRNNQQKPDRSQEHAHKPNGYPDIPADSNHGLNSGETGSSESKSPAKQVHAARQQSLANPFPGKEDDGGESTLSSRPRETGGERP